MGRREQLLAVTREDVMRVADAYLVNAPVGSHLKGRAFVVAAHSGSFPIFLLFGCAVYQVMHTVVLGEASRAPETDDKWKITSFD